MSNSRPINWYGSPLIRAIGTALLFLSLVSVPIVTSAQNLGRQPATGQAVQGEQAIQVVLADQHGTHLPNAGGRTHYEVLSASCACNLPAQRTN